VTERGAGLAWSNWSGSVACAPAGLPRPRSEDEIAALVRRAAREGRSVRAAGSGHSFSPLVATSGYVVSLDEWAGVESVDASRLEATVRAGTKLRDLGEPLLSLGMAMENLGDVDVQSLGGALGTGTHGTGRGLRNLSAQVSALRLVLASGELVECSAEREPDLFAAARVSFGALGVVTAARLRLLPAYRLHERIERGGLAACLERLEEEIASNRHFEFFWYPQRDFVEAKRLNPTAAEPGDVADPKRERIGWSARILPSVRELEFNEMEYSVPAESGPACFRAVEARMRARWPAVEWPVEYRTLRRDDAWLSTAHGRETVTISIHQDARLPFRELFADLEAVFAEHAGRPHWGKVHTRRAEDLAALYPRFEDFRRLRRRLDPQGVLLNDHLRALLGE
jgi:FAD/FMN-containing dehydrogenase